MALSTSSDRPSSEKSFGVMQCLYDLPNLSEARTERETILANIPTVSAATFGLESTDESVTVVPPVRTRKPSSGRVGIYAGSFDPPTVGHLWMIEQAATLFDELIVALGVNPEKRNTFTVEERLEMLSDCASRLRNVRVESFTNEFLINYARKQKA